MIIITVAFESNSKSNCHIFEQELIRQLKTSAGRDQNNPLWHLEWLFCDL